MLSKSGVCAGISSRPAVDTPIPARSPNGVVKPVVAMTSSASKMMVPAPSLREVRTRNPSPVRATSSMRALSSTTPPPRMWSSYGWT